MPNPSLRSSLVVSERNFFSATPRLQAVRTNSRTENWLRTKQTTNGTVTHNLSLSTRRCFSGTPPPKHLATCFVIADSNFFGSAGSKEQVLRYLGCKCARTRQYPIRCCAHRDRRFLDSPSNVNISPCPLLWSGTSSSVSLTSTVIRAPPPVELMRFFIHQQYTDLSSCLHHLAAASEMFICLVRCFDPVLALGRSLPLSFSPILLFCVVAKSCPFPWSCPSHRLFCHCTYHATTDEFANARTLIKKSKRLISRRLECLCACAAVHAA